MLKATQPHRTNGDLRLVVVRVVDILLTLALGNSGVLPRESVVNCSRVAPPFLTGAFSYRFLFLMADHMCSYMQLA